MQNILKNLFKCGGFKFGGFKYKSGLGGVVLAGALALSTLTGLEAKVILNVDGTEITDSNVNAVLKQQNVTFDSLSSEQKNQLLEGLIANILVSNAAKKEGLDKSDTYKMANLNMLAELWQQKQAESIGKTINVGDADAKKFYDDANNKPMFVMQSASFRHILVQKEDQAKNIISEIAKAPKTKVEDKIAELAKKYSGDEGSKKQGGLMEIPSISQLAPEFASALKGMSAGTYTKTPVKTAFGYHIIYLKKLGTPQTISFDKAKPQIIAMLKQQKFLSIIQEKVKKMRESAKISYGDKK